MKETVISRADLFALLEYSCSIPSGTIIGKRWRRDIHAYRTPSIPDELHEWKIGEYIEDPDPDTVGIRWTWAVNQNHEPHRGKHL
jgi:hypothetical protein